MDFEIPDHVRAIRQQVREFIEENVYPVEAAFETRGSDEAHETLRDLMAKAKKAGLWALGHPEEIGGQGLPFLDYVYVNEVIGRS
jgi:alkylation response protein AidB-like acyl-CoA dehydrogenase